eukprot:1150096-Pelagomonas_calceolata.AAC.1
MSSAHHDAAGLHLISGVVSRSWLSWFLGKICSNVFLRRLLSTLANKIRHGVLLVTFLIPIDFVFFSLGGEDRGNSPYIYEGEADILARREAEVPSATEQEQKGLVGTLSVARSTRLQNLAVRSILVFNCATA